MSMIPHGYGNGRGFFDPFSMDVWDPFKDYLNQSNEMFNASSFVNTCIDWGETKEAHIFEADLPGMKKEEVKVEVEDDRVLQITGERSRELEESSDRWHRVERSSGKFMRRFRLPENVKMDKIKAAMENGVLNVTVPKDEGVKRENLKSIEISG